MVIKRKTMWSTKTGRDLKFEIGPAKVIIQDVDKHPIICWLFAIKGVKRVTVFSYTNNLDGVHVYRLKPLSYVRRIIHALSSKSQDHAL